MTTPSLDLVTEEKMKAIYKIKQELIATGTIAQETSYNRQEVLDSWKRSLAFGLDPKHM